MSTTWPWRDQDGHCVRHSGRWPARSAARLTGTYGALTLNANGSYTYVVDNANAAVQALRLTDDTLSEAFTYTMRDTAGAIASATLTITIPGANDTPVAVDNFGLAAAPTPTIMPVAIHSATFCPMTLDVNSGDSKTVTRFVPELNLRGVA